LTASPIEWRMHSPQALRVVIGPRQRFPHREEATTTHAPLSHSAELDSRPTLWPPEAPRNSQTLLQYSHLTESS